MNYNFDEIVERKGTGSLKVEGVKVLWGREDLMPLWVADMDFRTPSFVIDAMEKRIKQGVLGYSYSPQGWNEAVASWVKNRHNWEVEKSWISSIAGVVPGMSMTIQCYTNHGDAVLIQPPVYHHFKEMVQLSGRELRENVLVLEGDNYSIDFDDFEQKVKGCKLFLLCNPHNPGGRVWSRAELERMAEICARHQVLVISDEIHADMVHKPYQHTPFASVSEVAANNSVTLMSATKSFNMPAISMAYTVIPNVELRNKLSGYLEMLQMQRGNILAYDAMMEAYTQKGTEWLTQMLDYIRETMDYMEQFFLTELPSIKMIRPQASFLVWLDCRGLGLSQRDLCSLFEDGAHLALNNGAMFGKGGEGFMRMNIASPRSTIEEALKRLKIVVDNYN